MADSSEKLEEQVIAAVPPPPKEVIGKSIIALTERKKI